MLARLRQGVLQLREADHTLFLAVVVVIAIRIEAVSLFNREDASGCDDLLLDETQLWRELIGELHVDDALKGISGVVHVLANSLHNEGEILLSPISLVASTCKHC